MSRTIVLTAFVALLALFASPVASASAASSKAPAKTYAKGPIAKASCPWCIPVGVALVRAAVTQGAKQATKKGAAAVTRATARARVPQAARPIIRASKKVRAGREKAAKAILTAQINAYLGAPLAVKRCFAAGAAYFIVSQGNYRGAITACASAAATAYVR